MSALLIRALLLAAIFGSVFVLSQLVFGLTWNRRRERDAVNKRLKMLRAGLDREAVSLALLKNVPPPLSPDAGPLERLYARFARMVMMSAVPIESRALMLIVGLGFLAALALISALVWIAKFSFGIGVLLLIVTAAAGFAIGLPLIVLGRIAERRRARMEQQFPVALDVFTRSLRAGHPVAAAIQLVTEEMPDPIGSEFGLVSDEIAYGANLPDALSAMAERWGLDDMRMFVVSISVQNETGGNLAEILENLSRVIRDRASMFMMVRALSSEGRMTGWLLTGLPVLAFCGLMAINPAFYLDVARDPIFVIGFPALLLLYTIGFISIRRLVDIKV
ncbi:MULTISPECIES: type II secretion system F family protein [Sphingomonas]|uniref:type II secretion system F family protein n=1 Tax=Sphingomonas TaxID=13687 RepID=UPI00092919F7|nr:MULTISPECIES: type II secretion system F family protein [Sphingomonas]MCW6528731.1 type II secretion system F family protein [Sphingomonas lycopersici]OJU17136.1 MAG: secretion system protein [Sphingomonas sp. 66-10]